MLCVSFESTVISPMFSWAGLDQTELEYHYITIS